MKFQSEIYEDFRSTFFSKEYVAYIIVLGALFIHLYLLDQSILHTSIWGNLIFVLLAIAIMWIRASTHTKEEAHKKKFVGQIEISPNEILWNGRAIYWEEISKFSFVLRNYEGEYYHSINEDLVNKIASGINNPIHIVLKEGSSLNGNVAIKSKYELKDLKELLHEIVRQKKVSLPDAMRIIGPSNYKEIQEFKKWYADLK